MVGKWKPDSGKPRPAPPQLQDFVQSKQLQFIAAIVGGNVAGALLTAALFHFVGGVMMTGAIAQSMGIYITVASVVSMGLGVLA